MLNLNEVEKKPLISLSENSAPEMAGGFIGEQSAKLHLALGVNSPGVETLSASMTSGNSDAYKRLLADQEYTQRIESRNDVLAQIMQAGPENINPEMIETVRGLSDLDLQSENLGNVIERNYAKLYTNTAVSSLDNEIVQDAREVDDEGSLELMDRTERVVYKKNLIATKAAEMQKKADDLSWGESIWNFTERVIPFLEWYQKQNATGESEMVSSWLPGNNLEEQFSYMWNISDPSEFAEKLEVTLKELGDRNVYVAQSWLQGLVSYGSSDIFMDNMFGVADVATAVPLKTLAGALKGVAKASIKNPTKLYKHTAEIGKLDDAAVGKVVEELQTGTFLDPDINDFKALEQSVPSIFAPDTLLSGSQNVPQAAYLRLKESLKNSADLAQRFLTEPNLIDRADPEELLKYKDVLLESYVKANPSIQKNVIDVRISDTADIGNVYQAEVVLGKRDGTLFESAEQAKNYFKRNIGGTDDFVVRQVGQGFEIAIKRTVDESKFLTDLTLPTLSKTPQSLGTLFGGWWRSPNYLVSRNSELQRSTAVTSMERMGAIYEELAEPFTRLSKDEVKELNDLMAVNQHSAEFKNYGEFEHEFYLKYAKNPTLDQAETYFAAKQMMDLDLIVRDLDWYKQKAIQGREKVTVGDQTFEGKVLDDLPFGSPRDFSYTVFKDGAFQTRKSSKFAAGNESERKALKALLDDGYKVVQVANQRLKIGEKSYVGFVVTKNLKRDRVGLQNIQRRPGGHKVDTYVGYAKQGVFDEGTDRTFYNSDKTLWGFKTEKEGRDFVKGLETARQMVNAKDPNALKFIRDTLGIDTKRWTAAVKSGEIDLSKKFVFTPKGKRTIDTGEYDDLPNIQTGVDTMDSRLIGRYGSERDESAIDLVRSESEIAFEIKGAEFLSPIDTLRMSAKNVISTRMMHDYTLVTHRNFIREFGDVLQGTREEQLSSGVSTLTNPVFKEGADREKIRLATNVSRSYKNLLNQGTKLDNLLEQQKDKLVGTIAQKFGSGRANWVADRLLPTVKDPAVAMRSFAFHTKMGFFNPVQYAVQANSMVNVVSIGGANGFRSAAMYPMLRLALISNTPEVVKGIGKKAQALGLMNADDFAESVKLYKKSGFNQIGKDTAYLDDTRGPEIRKSKGKTLLDYGATPFNEGERLVRLAAWNTAYLEAKKAGKALSRRDEAVILQRAKDLTANMTRESNATWQKGYAGLVTQFMGYQARIMEQFIGKKLTSAEKLRLFVGYSAAYGLPVATGATLGILPVREIFMDYLAQEGVDPQGWAEPLIDGLTSGFYELLTGDELNFARRYGPGGLPTIYDFLREDSTWSDVFLGASGSIAIDTISSSLPLFRNMASEFMDFEGGTYNLTADDFLAPLRNISSVDSLTKVYQVYNTGIWMSKNGTDMTEMDLPDAVVSALTGLTPERIDQAFRDQDAMKSWKEEKQGFMRDAEKEYRDLMRMEESPTRDKMVKNLKARMIQNGLSLQEMKQVWLRGYNKEMMVDSVTERYLKKLDEKKRRELNGVQ